MTKLLVTATLFLFSLLLSLNLSAVDAATPDPVEACPLWKTAGLVDIFKCQDDEPPWATCYVPVAGVMQCVIE